MRLVQIPGPPFVVFLRALLDDPAWLATGDAVLARSRLAHAAGDLAAQMRAPAPSEGPVPAYALELESADYERLLAVANAPRGGYALASAESAAAGLRALRSAGER